jgi:hypothetical protein
LSEGLGIACGEDELNTVPCGVPKEKLPSTGLWYGLFTEGNAKTVQALSVHRKACAVKGDVVEGKVRALTSLVVFDFFRKVQEILIASVQPVPKRAKWRSWTNLQPNRGDVEAPNVL